MPMAMKVAPLSPSASRMTSVAGVLERRAPAGPSACTQTKATAAVEQDHAGNAEQQSAREVALRIAHFACDEARGLPAAVGEHHRSHGRADRGEGRHRSRMAAGCGCAAMAGREPESGDAPARRSRGSSAPSAPLWTLLPERTPRQLMSVSSARTATATALSGDGKLDEIAEIAREGDRDRGHSARLDDQQQRPAVEEGRHRPVGVAQIGILAADLRAGARRARRKRRMRRARRCRRGPRRRR